MLKTPTHPEKKSKKPLLKVKKSDSKNKPGRGKSFTKKFNSKKYEATRKSVFSI